MLGLRRVFSWLLVLAFALAGAARGGDLFEFKAAKPTREIGADYFGTHFHRLWAADAPGYVPTSWPDGEIGTVRLWDSNTRWADVEPRRGQFVFDRLDFDVASAQSHHASVLLVLGSPAAWASARPEEAGPYGRGSAAEPADLDDWDLYVATVARRYKGRIAYYELWNEPFFSDLPNPQHLRGFFTGSVATMVELARRARAVLDREDPGAVLLTPGIVDGAQLLEMFFNAGGGRYVGGVAYHYYTNNDRDFLELHQRIKDVLARHQLSTLPIFNTEAGFNSTGSGASAGAEMLARQMILGAFVGLDRYYQYAWDNSNTGMSGTSLGPPESRSGEAYWAVHRWLLGARPQSCHHRSGDIEVCEALRDGRRLYLVWRTTGEAIVMWTLPAGERAVAVERAVTDAHLSALDQGNTVAISADPVAVWLQPGGAPTPAGSTR